MPEGMTFLPDERDVELSPGVGIVSAPAKGLDSLGAAAVLNLQEESWRGLLAFCLLADAWGLPPVTIRQVQPESSAFARAVLPEQVSLVLWENQLLGTLHPQAGVLPAARMEKLTLPQRVYWYDGKFADPTLTLNERDRTLLMFRLSALKRQGEGCMQRFLSALTQASLRTSQAAAHMDSEARRLLSLRIRAILGHVPGVTAEEGEYTPSVNPLLSALGAVEHAQGLAPAVTWLYNGRPFARSHSAALCESTGHGDEAATLAALEENVALMERYSPAWRADCSEGIRRWLHQHRDDRALLPALRTLMEEIARQLGQPRAPEPLHLCWPWTARGATLSLWQEAMGTGMEDALARPFADKLCLLPGGAWTALQNECLSQVCVLPGTQDTPAAAVVPPMSQALAAQAGDRLLPERLTFRRVENGIQVTMTLYGHSPVVLERTYAGDECRTLAPEDAPTLAQWPCVALEGWRAYYVYLHGGSLRAAALDGDAWRLTEDRLFSVVETAHFPGMIALLEGECCLGVVPNRAEPLAPAAQGHALGVMEVGASGLALALQQGEAARPVQLPGLLRMLLLGGRHAPVGEEFLPGTPLGPVLPAAVELFSRAEEPAPFVDGHILLAESCQTLAKHDAKNLHAAWKWHADAPARRARRLMLRQAMLMTSLAAALQGATAIAWRIGLPEGMAAEGRRELWQDVGELAMLVSAHCGLPLAQSQVSQADESLALGTYLRTEGNIRGGFLALDVGSSNACLALWLRGMNRPAARVCLPMGTTAMLLDGLLQCPAALEEDFANLPDRQAREDLCLLARHLSAAQTRPEMEKCSLLLENCLAHHGPALFAHMNGLLLQGRTTALMALMLHGFAVLLFLCGTVLEQAGEDPLLNDHLPAEITLMLTGRGSWLMASLPENVKAALARFTQMCLGGRQPVGSLRFLFSSAPKEDVVLGLACVKDAAYGMPSAPQSLRPNAAPAAPEAQAARFLQAFAAVFPQAACLLYAHVYEADGTLAATGSKLLQAGAARHFTPDVAPEAALAALLADLRQLNPTERL